MLARSTDLVEESCYEGCEQAVRADWPERVASRPPGSMEVSSRPSPAAKIGSGVIPTRTNFFSRYVPLIRTAILHNFEK